MRHTTDIHTPSASCSEVDRLLPWYLNSSLEADERATLNEHLSACDRCSSELANARDLYALLESHVPTADLVSTALATASGETAESVMAHLDHCQPCSQQFALVRGDAEDSQGALDERSGGATILRFGDTTRTTPAPQRNAGRRWHELALAAAFGALVIGAAFHLRDPGTGYQMPAQRASSPRGTLESAEVVGTLFLDGFESGSLEGWSQAPSEAVTGASSAHRSPETKQ